MNNFEIKNQYGRSMIEMLGVLAIIGVLSVGGIAGYSKAMHRYRINKAIEQITLIAGNMRAFFGRMNDWTDALCYNSQGKCPTKYGSDCPGCPVIKKAKIVPDEMLTLDDDGKIGAITGVFDRPVHIMQNAIEYDTDNTVETCIDLLSHDWIAANFERISFNCPYYFSLTLPVELDTIVEKCEYAVSKNCREIMFHFKK